MNKEEKPKTVKLYIIISLILSISAIILILYFTLQEGALQQLATTQIRYEFFLLAVIATFLYWVLWGLRIKILSNAIDNSVKISLWEATKIIFANLFLANITPSMAGGEPVRIYLLNKDGLSVGEATAVVLGERLIDAIFLLMCFPFAFFILRNYILRNYIEMGALQVGVMIAVGVFISAIIIFIYVLVKPDKTKIFLEYIGKKLSRFSKDKDKAKATIKKISTEVDHFHDSMIFFVSKGKVAFIKAGFVTVIFWVTGWMVSPLLLMGLGLEPYIIESCAVQVLLIIVIMMPTTPGSAGISEYSTTVLYNLFINSPLIGVFVLLFRFLSYYLGLIIGAIFMHRIFKSVASFSMDIIKKHE